MPKFEFLKDRTKESFKRTFGYDVTEVSEYINMESDELTVQLVASSMFLDRINIDTDVKHKKLIKILKGSVALREMTNCSMPSGSTLEFDEVTLETKLIGFAEEFCNQDLLSGWTQLLLRSGARAQLEELPAEQQASALFLALLKKAIEDLIFKGDTASPDSALNIFDGLIKLWTNDADVASVGMTLPMSVTNAYDNFKLMARAFSDELLESGLDFGIIASPTDYNFLVDNLINNNNYHYTAEESERGLKIPGTDVYVKKQRQLATGEVFGVVYPYITFGTDREEDMSEIKIKELADSEKIRVSAFTMAGVNYAFGDQFKKV